MMASAESIFILTVALIICSEVTVISARSITNIDTPEGLQYFLQSLGYAEGLGERTVLTYAERRAAIMKFQEFTGLPKTGVVDAATRQQMLLPRCGLPDFPLREARYELYGRKWNVSEIKWVINQTHPSIPYSEAVRMMQESVQEWQKWMDILTITQSSDPNSVIVVNYAVPDADGEHGDGNPFKNTTLAHAFYPTRHPLGGDIHYNMVFEYSLTEPPDPTKYSHKDITVHELGHALGLRHSNIRGSVMYPYTPSGAPYNGTHTDDIMGIRALYGYCFDGRCKNGGTCTRLSSGYKCTCPANYTGTDCETVYYCYSGPCQNGGTCTNYAIGYTCQCPSTHTGTNCETVLPCNSSPCQNGGTCTNNVGGGYTCQCPSTHTGTNCESALPCSMFPCQNGGTCTNNVGGGYTCQCPSTYTGTKCESALPCNSSPCQNGGTCTNNVGGGYTCQCPSTHTGTNCESVQSATPCSTSPCRNGGTCYPASNADGYTCQCTTSYTGAQCTVSKCAVNPCLNGGTCSLDPNRSSGYRCSCTVVYTGDRCQGTVCDVNPCENGGTCRTDATQNTGYRCICAQNYDGPKCASVRRIVNSGVRTAPWWTVGITCLATWWFLAKQLFISF